MPENVLLAKTPISHGDRKIIIATCGSDPWAALGYGIKFRMPFAKDRLSANLSLSFQPVLSNG